VRDLNPRAAPALWQTVLV